MRKKILMKKLAVIGTFTLLGVAPLMMSATNQLLDVTVTTDVAKDTKQNLLSVDAETFYKASLNDNAGLEAFLTSLKSNALIALYRKEFSKEYNELIEKERTDLEAQKKTYRDLYGESRGNTLFAEQLKNQGYDTEEEYLLGEVRTSVSGVAFTELYKNDTKKETDDNGTADDKTDDVEYSYDALSGNQLFWFNDWFTETKPLHVSQITFTLKGNEDFKVLEMEDKPKKKFAEFLTEVNRLDAITTTTPLDFGGLAGVYSTTNANTNGHLGLLNYNENQVSDVPTRYNIYNFINDITNKTLRTGSEIDLATTSTPDAFLKLFESGERNYFYTVLRNEKFLITRTTDNKIAFTKFFGMRDYIDPASAPANSNYQEYFKTAPKRFRLLDTAPFTITDLIKTYIRARSYNEYLFAVEKDVIKFNDAELISGDDMKLRIKNYIDTKQLGKIMRKDETFIKTINDQNEKWKESEYKSEIKTTDLVDETKWVLWG